MDVFVFSFYHDDKVLKSHTRVVDRTYPNERILIKLVEFVNEHYNSPEMESEIYIMNTVDNVCEIGLKAFFIYMRETVDKFPEMVRLKNLIELVDFL